jgi:tRNA1(Val) A37 N6-methylase TrmN6
MENIIKNGQIDIDEEQWIDLNNKYDKQYIKQLISDTIEENNLELPYCTITMDEVEKDFQNLCNLNTSTLIKNGKFVSRYLYEYSFLDRYIDQINTGNKASNYFQQENRFKCDSINSPSPYRTWTIEKFRMTLLSCLWTLKFTKINNNILRSAISLRKYISSQFKPSVAKYIYDVYGGESVLDFSSGWGDRLLGFYANYNTVRYVGIDPNIEVIKKYNEQVKVYSQLDMYSQYGVNKETLFINSPAEDVILNEKFDLIFTSPPYFDIERYTQEKNQSWKKYKNFDNWMDDFLLKTIGGFWNNLNPKGHLIINISDVYCHHKVQKICDRMNNYISTLKNAQYVGAIGMRMTKRPCSKALQDGVFAEPIWIWKKI